MKAKCRPENSWKRQSALVKFYAKMTGIKNYEEVKNTFENLKILKNNFRKGVVTMTNNIQTNNEVVNEIKMRIRLDYRWDDKLEFYWMRNILVGTKERLMAEIKGHYLKYYNKVRWAIIDNVENEEYEETIHADGRIEIPERCIIPETKRSKYLNA